MAITKSKLEQWIEESLETTHTKIDDAQSKDYPYIKQHYEGYLECLMHLQYLLDTQ